MGRSLARLVKAPNIAKVVSSVSEALQCLEPIEAFRSLVADVRLPDGSGLHVVRQARLLSNLLPITVISGFQGYDYDKEAYQLGAFFLYKPFGEHDFAALCAFINGECKFLFPDVFESYARSRQLTKRGKDILRLALSGEIRESISYALNISPNTLKWHISRLLDKCEARNLSDLVRKLVLGSSATPDLPSRKRRIASGIRTIASGARTAQKKTKP